MNAVLPGKPDDALRSDRDVVRKVALIESKRCKCGERADSADGKTARKANKKGHICKLRSDSDKPSD